MTRFGRLHAGARLAAIVWVVVLNPLVLVAQSSQAAQKQYLRIGSLRPDLQVALEHFGNRLSAPGKETLFLAGTVSRDGGPNVAFQATIEAPDKLRFEEGVQGSQGVSGFDGAEHWSNKGAVSKADGALLESLLLDSFERFFYEQQKGQTIRKIGGRFRIDGASRRAYSGPVYDIYEVADERPGNGVKNRVSKTLYVNSDTLLLERIEYRSAEGTVAVTLLEKWSRMGEEWIPGSITRFESGKEVLRLAITAATTAAIQPAAVYKSAAGKP